MKRLIFILIICIGAFIGEIMCIYKMINCNWKPIGKAEILYTIGSLTGLGSVIGYFDFDDE